MTKMDALQIISTAFQLLQPIPPNEWLVGRFTNGKDKCCAVGHFERLTKNPADYSERNCFDIPDGSCGTPPLRVASKMFLPGNQDITWINNSSQYGFPQKTVKGRVMAFLKKILEENGFETGNRP